MQKLIPANEWLQGEMKEVKFAKKPMGKKGQLMVELQKSYKGDSRFEMNSKFDDVDLEKLPKKFKENQSQLIEADESEGEVEQQPLRDEVNQQLNILTQLMPEHRAFISYQKKPDKKKYNLIVPKFDPNNIDKRLFIKKETEQQKKDKEKKSAEIVKGVDKKTIKMDKANQILSRQIQKHEVSVKIDRGAWKDIIQTKEGQNSLFS